MKISDHVKDVRGFAETVLPGRRPVFISHRSGGREIFWHRTCVGNHPPLAFVSNLASFFLSRWEALLASLPSPSWTFLGCARAALWMVLAALRFRLCDVGLVRCITVELHST